jgi:RNA polymerase-binding transcription factor DksA
MPAKKAKSKAKAKKKAKAKTKSAAKKKPKVKSKAKAKAKTGARARPKVKAKVKKKAKAAAKKKPKTKAKAKVKTAAKKKTTKAWTKTKARSKVKTKTKAKAKTKPKPKPKAKLKARAKPKAEAVKKAEPKPPPAPRIRGKKLTKKELDVARMRILAERKRIIMELGRIEETISDATKDKEGSNQSYSNHLADIGTDLMEQEKNFYYASQEGHYLRALDEALERVKRGTYGICEACTLRIGNPRLEAVPSARQCIKCKSESEKNNRGR